MPKVMMSKFDASANVTSADGTVVTGLGVRIVQRDDGMNVVEYSRGIDEMSVPAWSYSEVLDPRKMSGNVVLSKAFLKVLIEMAIENSK